MVQMEASLSITVYAASSPLTLLHTAAVAVLILLLPGWVVARVARLTAPVALGLAPALSCAIVGTAEVLAHAAGLPWRPWGWAVIGTLTMALCAAARLAAGPGAAIGNRRQVGRGGRRILAAGLAVAVAVPTLVFLTTLPGAGYPAQAFDAVFHLNAVAAIREGGNASMFGGLAEMYAGRSVYYPSIWHGIVALAPGSAVVATNGAILAVLALVWPLTVFGMLSRVVDADVSAEASRLARVIAVAATTAMTAGLVAFALLPMTALAVWPYSLSLLGLPGIMVVLDMLRHTAGPGVPRTRITLSILLLCACSGVMAAHGTGLFNLILLALPFLAEAVLWVRRRTGRARIWLLAGAAGGAIAVGIGAWRLRGALASVLSYRRPSGGAAGALGTLMQTLADLPMYGSYAGALVPVGAVFGVFVVAGAWAARHDRRLRPWLVLWALMLVFIVVVGGPQWVGRQLGSPWYLQKARIAPLVLFAALPLAATAVQVAVTRIAQHRSAARRYTGALVLLALVMLSVAGRIPLERALVASVYDPARIQYGTLVTADEIALFERAASVLPRDAVVIGSPSLGGSYLWSIGGVSVAYPMRAAPSAGTPQAALLSTWPNLGRSTCAALHELRAAYFFIDTDPTAAGSQTGTAPLRWDEPLTRLPETGVELVDSQGGAQLWRITACDRE
ncbi:DUF6541 family protein [Actinomyces sp.]|uniref:DUF6541 family protein n=1 Tax=Actinomyces sp. TaxID=29317 RepID=UPI0026DB7AF6|nr:DUF6541 family protein [Actinomyces sp.]MDO4899367.1 hypothetical protein [Actinomyces sp.]